MQSPETLAGTAPREHPRRLLLERTRSAFVAVWTPVAVLLAPHLVLRLVLLFLQRHSPAISEPALQLSIGFGDDLLVCTLLVAPAVAAALLTRRLPRAGGLVDALLSVLATAVLLFTIGSAVKVAHVGLALMPSDLRYWHEVPFALDSVRAYLLSPLGLSLAAVGIPLLGGAGWLFARSLRGLRNGLHALPPLLTCAAILVVGVVALALRHEVQERRIALLEPLENHPVHYVYSRLKDGRHADLRRPEAEIARLHDYLRSIGAEPTGDADWPTRNRRTPRPGAFTLPPKTNVLLITLEGMGRGPIVHRPEIAPFLARLEKRGLAFDAHVSTMFRTAGAQLGILCSMLDPPDFFVSRETSGVSLRCLPRVLKDAGYSTNWVGGSNGAFDHRKEWLLYNGVSHVVAEEDFGPEATERFSFGVHDEHLFARLASELDHAAEPFFTWALTVSNHHPYVQPESFLQRHPETASWDPIDRSYRYVDEQLERFFAAIEQRPWFSRTLVVLVGDHSPWGYAYGDPRKETDFRELRRRYETELLMLHPALAPGRHAGLTSHLDIAPTILGLLGLPGETDFLGEDALSGRPPRTRAFAEDNARNFSVSLFSEHEGIVRGLSTGTCDVVGEGSGRRKCLENERSEIDRFRETFLRPTEWEVTREAVRLGMPVP